jgi:hypothetical protein
MRVALARLITKTDGQKLMERPCAGSGTQRGRGRACTDRERVAGADALNTTRDKEERQGGREQESSH